MRDLKLKCFKKYLPPKILHRRCIGILQVQLLIFQLIFATMKFFALIMSVWLLILFCLPCGDSRECNGQRVTTISPNTNHQLHKRGIEHCTPFCSCSCCSISVSCSSILTYIIAKKVFVREKYSDYSTPFCKEVSHAIWQPPKIS